MEGMPLQQLKKYLDPYTKDELQSILLNLASEDPHICNQLLKKIKSDKKWCKLFVHGLAFTTKKETLENYYHKYGEVKEAVVLVDKKGKSKGFGFVTFSTAEEALNAVKMDKKKMDKKKIDGRVTHCNLAFKGNPKKLANNLNSGNENTAGFNEQNALSPKQRQDASDRRLFVHSLAWKTDDESLADAFRKFGDLQEAVVIKDKKTGKSKGYGFVTFRTAASAISALTNPNKKIDGRQTHCNLASERSSDKTNGGLNNNLKNNSGIGNSNLNHMSNSHSHSHHNNLNNEAIRAMQQRLINLGMGNVNMNTLMNEHINNLNHLNHNGEMSVQQQMAKLAQAEQFNNLNVTPNGLPLNISQYQMQQILAQNQQNQNHLNDVSRLNAPMMPNISPQLLGSPFRFKQATTTAESARNRLLMNNFLNSTQNPPSLLEYSVPNNAQAQWQSSHSPARNYSGNSASDSVIGMQMPMPIPSMSMPMQMQAIPLMQTPLPLPKVYNGNPGSPTFFPSFGLPIVSPTNPGSPLLNYFGSKKIVSAAPNPPQGIPLTIDNLHAFNAVMHDDPAGGQGTKKEAGNEQLNLNGNDKIKINVSAIRIPRDVIQENGDAHSPKTQHSDEDRK